MIESNGMCITVDPMMPSGPCEQPKCEWGLLNSDATTTARLHAGHDTGQGGAMQMTRTNGLRSRTMVRFLCSCRARLRFRYQRMAWIDGSIRYPKTRRVLSVVPSPFLPVMQTL